MRLIWKMLSHQLNGRLRLRLWALVFYSWCFNVYLQTASRYTLRKPGIDFISSETLDYWTKGQVQWDYIT